MAKTYKYATDLEGPDGNEHDVSVTYEVCWGTPETGRGYMADPYKYDPGSPDEIEMVKIVAVDGVEPTKAQEAWYLLSIEACYEDMLDAASEYEVE